MGEDSDDPKAGVPGTLDPHDVAQKQLVPFITCSQFSFFGKL